MPFSQAPESLGRAFIILAKARMKVGMDKVFRAQHCERYRSTAALFSPDSQDSRVRNASITRERMERQVGSLD